MSELDRWIGACLLPELRVPGTRPGHPGSAPGTAYLERFPPAGIVVFGRTPAGPGRPGPLIEVLRERCERAGGPTPFACCDLEQGAGHHFADAARLPPAQALGFAESGDAADDAARIAGERTGRDARARGVELVLAPVCDLDTHRANPIVSVRSFGADPQQVAAKARAFLAGLHAGGAGGCAKHWPGHGDTSTDSHLELPRVEHPLEQLVRRELVPFDALIRAGVEAVMVGHLDVPALGGEDGLPATLSPAALRYLRDEQGFGGAVLSDAMDMGALRGVPRPHARALAAGCDGLLCPADPAAAAAELREALDAGELDAERLAAAAAAMGSLRETLFARRPRPAAAAPTGAAIAAELAERCLWSPEPAAWSAAAAWRPREAFPGHGTEEALAAVGAWLAAAPPDDPAAGIAVVAGSETLAGRGEAGLSPQRRARLRALLADLGAAGRPVGLVWLASPHHLPEDWRAGAGPPVVVGFAPTPPMVEAARAWLARPAERR